MTVHGRIAHRPRDIADCVSAYLEDGDIDGIMSMFHPNCLIFFPPDQPPKAGIAGVRAAFEELLEVRPRIESNVTSEVIVGDTAMLCATWTRLGSGRHSDGRRPVHRGGKTPRQWRLGIPDRLPLRPAFAQDRNVCRRGGSLTGNICPPGRRAELQRPYVAIRVLERKRKP